MDQNNQNPYQNSQIPNAPMQGSGQPPVGQNPIGQTQQMGQQQIPPSGQVQPLAPNQPYNQPYSPDQNQQPVMPEQSPATFSQDPSTNMQPPTNNGDTGGGGGSSHKKIIIILIGVLLLAGIGMVVAGFFLFGNPQNDSKTALAPTPTPSQAEQATPQEPTVDPTLQAAQASIRTQAYNVLIDYLASTVQFRLEATECCGTLSINETIQQLTYLNDATPPWNFDQENELIQKIKTSQKELYGDMTIGIAENNYFFAYSTNDSGKIDKISIGSDYTLLFPLEDEDAIGPKADENKQATSSSTPNL